MLGIRSQNRIAITIFYLLFTCTVISIFFTHPFLIYPFDPYIHLSWIEKQNSAAHVAQRETWHWLWAKLFHVLDMDHTSIWYKAYVIHYTQTIAIFLMLFYFSTTILKYLFTNISSTSLLYLAYWSTLLWFTILATYSAYHHEVWIVWYSVTYQLTLPLSFVALAVFISLLFQSKQFAIQKIFKAILIFLIIIFILNIHPMELLYLLLYFAVFTLLYIDRLWQTIKNLGYWVIPILGLIVLFLINLPALLQRFSYREIPLFHYLSFDTFPELINDIVSSGNAIVPALSRSKSYMNTLIYLDLFLLAVISMIVLYRYLSKKTCYFNLRLFMFVVFSSLLLFIPQNLYTAGFAAILTYKDVVYRFAYSSLLFLVLPVSIYYLLVLIDKISPLRLNLILAFVILAVACYSAFVPFASHNYAKNILSLAHMYSTEKRTFPLSKNEIETIGSLLQKIEKNHTTTKPLYYYARPDIAYVIKYLYHRHASVHIKPTKKGFAKAYAEHNNTAFEPVLFPTPSTFPPYRPYTP